MSFLNQAIGSNMLLSTRKNKKNEILKTYDYEIFKRIKGNRLVNNSHVNNLVKSMKEKYLPQPILVNKDMEIIDGQHRFAAAEELSLPIHYLIIDGGIGEVQRLNTNTKNWKNEDYLNMFCDREFEDYLLFKRFMKEYQFSLETTLSILLNTHYVDKPLRDDFKNGKFKIKDATLALKNAEKILQIKPYYKGWNRRSFARALLIVFKIKEYNHSVFINKLKYCSHMLQHKLNTATYLATIEEIYNFNSRTNYIYLTRKK